MQIYLIFSAKEHLWVIFLVTLFSIIIFSLIMMYQARSSHSIHTNEDDDNHHTP
jgi:hypothetical protein